MAHITKRFVDGLTSDGTDRLLFDDKLTKCTMNRPGSVQAIQWWADLRHKYHVDVAC